VVVLHERETSQPRDEPLPPPSLETAEQPVITPRADQVTPAPAPPPEIPRLIDNVEQAPDPFDVRRQRRDQRRSRRVED
jgi:hypothetical protein